MNRAYEDRVVYSVRKHIQYRKILDSLARNASEREDTTGSSIDATSKSASDTGQDLAKPSIVLIVVVNNAERDNIWNSAVVVVRNADCAWHLIDINIIARPSVVCVSFCAPLGMEDGEKSKCEYLRAPCAPPSSSTPDRVLLHKTLSTNSSFHGIHQSIPNPGLILALGSSESNCMGSSIGLCALHCPRRRVTESLLVAVLVNSVENRLG